MYGVNAEHFDVMPISDIVVTPSFKHFYDSAKIDKIRTKAKHGLGYYQCFCSKYKTKVVSNKLIKDLCMDYVEDVYGAKAFSYGASFLIVTFNVVIRFVNIAIIN
jgi:hypothetical protein